MNSSQIFPGDVSVGESCVNYRSLSQIQKVKIRSFFQSPNKFKFIKKQHDFSEVRDFEFEK